MKISLLLPLSLLIFSLFTPFSFADDTEVNNLSSGTDIKPSPVNLTASKGKFSDKISLKWEPVPGSVKYYIYRSQSEEGTSLEIGNTESLFYDDLKAEAGNLYYYRIKAGFIDGKFSEPCIPANGFLKLASPVLALSNTEPDKLILTWEKIRSAERYYIYRSESTDDYKEIGIVESMQYEDKTVPGKTFYYKIKAFSGMAQFSDFSNNVTGVTKLGAPVITASSDSSSSVILKWNAIQGADEYYIYRSDNNTENYEVIKNTKTVEYEDSAITPGRIFNYKIRSYTDKTGFSEFSNKASGAIKLSGPEVSVSERNIGKLKLEWKTVTGAEKYYVYRSLSESGSYEKIAETDNTVHIDENIDPEKAYYYKVIPWSQSGFGCESNILPCRSERTSAGLYTRTIVPGWAQYYNGRHTAGIVYASAFAFSAVMTGLSFYLWETAWQEYSELPYGTSESTFDSKYNNYRYATYSVWGFAVITAAIYILNWADILYFNNSSMNADSGVYNWSSDNKCNMLGFYLYRDNEFNENRVRVDFDVRF